MKYRFKFTKLGRVKFISHLDLLRLWQKAIKMAAIPVAYSAGFNPHQKILIAFPLSLGVESIGEYIDIQTTSAINIAEAINSLNNVMPKGVKIVSAYGLNEKDKNAMSIISAASYKVKGLHMNTESISSFMSQKCIPVEKKTKSGIKTEDIKNQIIKIELNDDTLDLTVVSGNVTNLKPELVVKGIYDFVKIEYEPFSVMRTELYKNADGKIIPLDTVENWRESV